MKAPAKAELKWRIEQLEVELKRRIFIGSQMSNVCFNLSQRTCVTDNNVLRDLYQQWDAIKRVAP